MQITGSATMKGAPQEQLAQMAQRWRARAAIADAMGAGEVSFTITTDPAGARAMAGRLDRLLDFSARVEAQTVALAALRLRQDRVDRLLFKVVFAEMAVFCAGLLWIQWLALSGVLP